MVCRLLVRRGLPAVRRQLRSVRQGRPGTTNPSGFCDAGVDRLLSQATAEQSQNPAAAVVLWQKAESAILAQAPFIPTYNPQDVSFASKRVGNFQYNPQWQVLIDQLWIK